jgi:hypothetical protein
MNLYIWDNAVFALASNLDEARAAASDRVASHRCLLAMIRDSLPQVLERPAVHIAWHALLHREVPCELVQS